MTANEHLVGLAQNQRTVLKNLMKQLFDKSIEGLNATKKEVGDLQERHAWYHSNIYQLRQLKSQIESIQVKYDRMINEILSDIYRQQEQSKEILLKYIADLKSSINTAEIRGYLNELMDGLNKVIIMALHIVLLKRIFGSLGIFAVTAAIAALLQVGSSLVGFATLGVGFIGAGTASEIAFRVKLSELHTLLVGHIKSLENKRSIQLQNLDVYFDKFVQRLRQSNSDDSTIDIAWFDENLHNEANRSFLRRLSREFSSETCRIIELSDKAGAIRYVESSTERDIILITSGSAGEHVISAIGHSFNITGIIIYCMLPDIHRKWAQKYKKMLLVSDKSDEVVEKIRQIKSGNIYFIINGFSLDDIKQKNINYYFSTGKDGFAIQNFEFINRNESYHRGIVKQLHDQIVSKNIYPNGVPEYFQLANLNLFVDEFLKALRQIRPEKSLVNLYSKQAPYYYQIINSILNRFDVHLLTIAGDYIKALRYALIMYEDSTEKIHSTTGVRLYRGLCLKHENSFEEFRRKFKVHDYIIFPSFFSTSLNKEIAKSFTKGKGVLLDILVDCKQVNKLKNISADSYYACENEVLLNCFQILKVTNINESNQNLLYYECTLATNIGS